MVHEEEKLKYHLFAVYDLKYEKYLSPMSFPDIKSACVEVERSVKTDYERGNTSKAYLKDIEIRLLGVVDADDGKLYNVGDDDSFVIRPIEYLDSVE